MSDKLDELRQKIIAEFCSKYERYMQIFEDQHQENLKSLVAYRDKMVNELKTYDEAQLERVNKAVEDYALEASSGVSEDESTDIFELDSTSVLMYVPGPTLPS
jgi:aminoglycoside/choline kinase family phosphotransferase